MQAVPPGGATLAQRDPRPGALSPGLPPASRVFHVKHSFCPSERVAANSLTAGGALASKATPQAAGRRPGGEA
jgi:hypothetical protein